MSSTANTDTATHKASDPYTARNADDPSLKEKVEDLLKFIDNHKFCMMTTQTANSDLLASRCMAVAGKENNGLDLLFHANTTSGKLDDLHSESHVNIAFLTPSGEWASVSGHAVIETDRDIVRKTYTPSLKAWMGDLGDGKHDGGPEDPRLCVIRVKTTTAQYAISRRTIVGAAVELAKGVVTGEVPAVNKLRHLSEEEVKQWKAGAGQ